VPDPVRVLIWRRQQLFLAQLRASASAFARFPAAIYSRNFPVITEIAQNLASTEKVLLRLLAERRNSPRPDLISALASVREGTDALSDADIVVLCNLLLFAGHETTANLLGGSVLHDRRLRVSRRAHEEG
jgi:cytochrome P450